MQYAVIKTGGKQYRVFEGSVIEVTRLPSKPSSEIQLDSVLLYVSNGNVSIGSPLLPKITVRAKVLEHVKAKKIKVAKYKSKSRFRRMSGFRQHLTRLQIEKIESLPKSKQKRPAAKK